MPGLNKKGVRFRLFILLTFFVTIQAEGQYLLIDSLQKQSVKLSGRAQIDALNELARVLSTSSHKKSIETALKAFQLSDKIDYSKGEILSIINQSIAEDGVGNKAQAIMLLKRAVELSRNKGEKGLEGYSLARLGATVQNAGKPDSAFNCYKPSLEILQRVNEPIYLSFLYLTMADYYELLQEPDIQFTYLQKSWQIREKEGDKRYLTFAGTRMAGYFIKKGDFNEALVYLDKSTRAIGKDTVDNEEINIIKQQRAIIYARLGDYPNSVKLFYQVKNFYSQNSYPQELTNLLLETSGVFEELGDYEVSLKDGLEALHLAEKNHFEFEKIKALQNLAWIYFDLNQLESAQQYMQNAVVLSKAKKQLALEATSYNLLGLIFVAKKQTSLAFNYLDTALTIRIHLNDKKGISNTFSNIGSIYSSQGNYQKALEYELKSLEFEEGLQRPFGLTYSYAVLGKLYTELNDFKKADEFLTKSEIFSKRLKVISKLIETYDTRRNWFQKQKKYEEALVYAKLYENVKDSVFNKNLSRRLSLLQYVYDLDQKDIEIKRQGERLEDQQARIKGQYLMLWVISGGMVLLIFLAALQYYNFRRIKTLNEKIKNQNRRLAEKKEEISAQNEELTQSNEEISTQRDNVASQNKRLDEAYQIIDEQNKLIKSRNKKLKKKVEKRTRELVEYIQQLEQFTFISSHNLRAPVARILGLGQLLELPDITVDDQHTIHKSLIQTAVEIDRVVKDLNTILEIRKNHNATLSLINFEAEWEIVKTGLEKEIEMTRAVIDVKFNEAPEIRTVAPYLESIIVNLVSNGIKYRKVGQQPIINIRTELRDSFICLIVKDFGLGIDLNLYEEKLFTLYKRFHDHVEGKGLGLYMVKTQIQSLGGKIEVESKVDVGTTFYVYFPIENGEKKKDKLSTSVSDLDHRMC